MLVVTYTLKKHLERTLTRLKNQMYIALASTRHFLFYVFYKMWTYKRGIKSNCRFRTSPRRNFLITSHFKLAL